MAGSLLFQEGRIGSLTVKNRIVMPALHLAYAEQGRVTERLIDFYRARAEGGAGLISVGLASVERVPNYGVVLAASEDSFVPGLAALAAAIRRGGAAASLQIGHRGRYAHSRQTGVQSVSASAVRSTFTGETPRELGSDEVEALVEEFVAAARRAVQAGFDAVEIIASAGYLINQFLSPLTNRRQDKWGGDLAGRCRFAIEIVSRTRKVVGRDVPILIRISGSDFMDGGHTEVEAARVAGILAAAGADFFNVTGGWHETRRPQITMDVPRGAYVYLAENVKAAVGGVPVAASNRINNPFLAEEILARGVVDYISIGRGLLADPEFPEKARLWLEAGIGRESKGTASIRTCVACNEGCLDRALFGEPCGCLMNPAAGREAEAVVKPARRPRRALVVGGGPAGMEAALGLALRGHQVTLIEKEDTLGGQLRLAAIPPGREELNSVAAYYARELPRAGVEIRLGREVLAQEIIGFSPEIVVLGTGSSPAFPEIPGLGLIGPAAVTARQVLSGQAAVGSRVVVIGAGGVGCETALWLAPGRQITLIRRGRSIGEGIGKSTVWIIIKALKELGVRALAGASPVRVVEEGLWVEIGEEQELLAADTLVLATGSLPNRGLYDELRALDPQGKIEVHLCGDARRIGRAIDAIDDAFWLVSKI